MVTKTLTVNVKVEIADVLKQFIDNPEEYTIVKKSDYEDLLDVQLFLNCLESSGVDNWEGYDEALNEYSLQKEEMVNDY